MLEFFLWTFVDVLFDFVISADFRVLFEFTPVIASESTRAQMTTCLNLWHFFS
jgi:hypothetical protein